jgi:phytoene desaturase
MAKKIIIIGSGFGGLGAAARLAARGHQVKFLKSAISWAGARYVYEINGFKFDGGPTVITAPFMFDDIFKAAGRKVKDYIQFVPCEPFYRIFDHQGRAFSYNNNMEQVEREIDRFNPADKEGYRRFMESTKPIFEKGFVELADKPFLHINDMLKVAPDLVRMQSYKSVYGYTAQFVQNEFLRQVLSFHPLLVGGNPFDAPSIYAMINYLMDHWGVWYAIGGTGAIVNALASCSASWAAKCTSTARWMKSWSRAARPPASA